MNGCHLGSVVVPTQLVSDVNVRDEKKCSEEPNNDHHLVGSVIIATTQLGSDSNVRNPGPERSKFRSVQQWSSPRFRDVLNQHRSVQCTIP